MSPNCRNGRIRQDVLSTIALPPSAAMSSETKEPERRSVTLKETADQTSPVRTDSLYSKVRKVTEPTSFSVPFSAIAEAAACGSALEVQLLVSPSLNVLQC